MSRLERVMNARKFEDLAKESESCKKKLKFFAENGVTVQSVMEEKQAKARKQAQLIQRMKKMNTTPQGATGADAVLAELIAKEEERKRAEARVPISPSEFKETAGGRKTRKKIGGNGDDPLPVRSRVRLVSPAGRNFTTGMTGTILEVENRDGQLLYKVEFDEPAGWDRVIGLIRMVPADKFDLVEEEEKDAWSSSDEEDVDFAARPSRRHCRKKGIASCPPPRKQGGQRKTRRKRRRKKRKSRRKKKTRRRRKKRKTRKRRH